MLYPCISELSKSQHRNRYVQLHPFTRPQETAGTIPPSLYLRELELYINFAKGKTYVPDNCPTMKPSSRNLPRKCLCFLLALEKNSASFTNRNTQQLCPPTTTTGFRNFCFNAHHVGRNKPCVTRSTNHPCTSNAASWKQSTVQSSEGKRLQFIS